MRFVSQDDSANEETVVHGRKRCSIIPTIIYMKHLIAIVIYKKMSFCFQYNFFCNSSYFQRA